MISKDYSISLLRLIAIIFIVFCHVAQQYDLEISLWLNMGVQIFLSISGYLYGTKNVGNALPWFAKRFEKIYVPYVMFLILAIFAFRCIDSESLTPDLLYSFLCVQAFFGTAHNLGHLWYVSIILLCYLLTPLLAKTLQSARTELWGRAAICLFCFASFGIAALTDCGYIAWLSSYFLGFYYSAVGYSKSVRKGLISMVWLLLGGLAALGTAFTDGAVESLLSKVAHIMLGLGIMLSCLAFVQSTSISRRNAFKKILDWNDKYSYAVYLVHLPFVLGTFSPLGNDLPFPNAIMYLLVAIPVILLIAYTLQRISDVVTDVINSAKRV